MKKPEEGSSLKDLDARIKAARRQQEERARPPARRGIDASGWAFGFRLAIDLISGIAAGVALGLLLDYWLGLSPLFLILFFFLGSAAGILNVYRSATRQGLAVGYRKPKVDKDEPEDKDSGNGA